MRRIAALAGFTLAALSMPASALAHGLVGRFESPLPLVVYLSGAAIAVALSFAFVLLRDLPTAVRGDARVVMVPRAVRTSLRVVGLLAWLWIVLQPVIAGGGGGDADVASLFLWVYGWVGLALLSALFFPAWQWLDPFVTIHDIGAALLRRFGIAAWAPVPYPERLGQWPAVAGFALFVWIELVSFFGLGGWQAAAVVVAYTLLTQLAMAQFGRDAWRSRGETFSVWFGTLNRLAPFGVIPGREDAVVRRPFARGLIDADWSAGRLALVAVGTGSIIYDGLSQTKFFFDLAGLPSLAEGTLLLGGFLAVLGGLVFAVARVAGRIAVGAGLVPIAVGYLIAHYLTFLLGDGQRIVVVISDPFLQGWDLFGTAFYEPGTDWIPPILLWTVVLGAVIGGHMLGAWSGHAAAAGSSSAQGQRRRELPLALLMIGLTVATLWSLGQTVVKEEAPMTLTPSQRTASASIGPDHCACRRSARGAGAAMGSGA